MQLIKLVVAALPALALADTSAAPTTTYTYTNTMTMVKTITLAQVHTVTSTWDTNSTSTTFAPTGGMTSFTPPAATTAPAPATKGPDNAAGVLDATKVAFAGVAGMLVVALM